MGPMPCRGLGPSPPDHIEYGSLTGSKVKIMLNALKLANNAFTALMGAESLKMHAYSGFTLVFILEGQRGADPKTVRKNLSALARNTSLIAKNTWESYVGSVDKAAAMFMEHASDEIATIRDMSEDDAVEAMRVLYEGLNIVSGGDIRLWATAGQFLPLDKEAMKAEKAAKAKAAKEAKEDASLALWGATNYADSSTLKPSEQGAAPEAANPMEALLSIIGRLTPEQLLDATVALNTRLTEVQDMQRAARKVDPKKAVVPVVADTAKVDPKSAQAARTARVAA